jgi:nitrite reductase/ring-hydroxylating ferredoxin subunit
LESSRKPEPAAYAAGEIFMQEKSALFAREWLPLCATAQLGEAGAFASATIGGWPLLALRDTEGALRGFRNTCRHQNMMVVEKPSGQLQVLRCRYHGWTYDLAGALIDAPALMAPPTRSPEATSLQAVALHESSGMILLSLQPGASPAGTPDGVAQGGHPSGPAHPPAIASVDVACNWKVAVEERLAAAPGGLTATYHWPLMMRYETDRQVLIEQIMPRSFLRTRLIVYAWTSPEADSGQAAAPVQALLGSTGSLETAQAARLAGSGAADTPAITQFHARWAAAFA